MDSYQLEGLVRVHIFYCCYSLVSNVVNPETDSIVPVVGVVGVVGDVVVVGTVVVVDVPVLHKDWSCYMLEVVVVVVVVAVVGAFSNFQRGKAAAKLHWMMNWVDVDSDSSNQCVNECV
jgi:hypothetical protein